MKAKLFRSGARRGEPFEFHTEATIGRGEENSVRLETTAVSSRHARIYFDLDRGRYYLEDLDSLNGTKLDGVWLTRPEPLERLHVLEFGGDGQEYVFQALDLSPPTEGDAGEIEGAPPAVASGTDVDREMPALPASLAVDSAEAAEMPPVEGTSAEREMPAAPQDLLDDREAEATLPVPVAKKVPETASVAEPTSGGEALFYLQFHEPADAEPIPLFPGRRVVGRARTADISVDSPSVSRRHALLSVGEKVTVRDLGSRNQTFVDDQRVDEEVDVTPGSVMRFGALAATLIAGVGS